MDQLKQQAAHLVMASIVIISMCVLAIKGAITGGEALGIIGTVGGLSAGGAVASSSFTGTSTTPTATLNVPVKATVTSSPSDSTSTPTNG